MTDHDSAAITVSNVSFAYGGRQALTDLSFSVQRNQMCGLLGPNGSGKTTLFRILGTLLPLQSGKVSISGSDLRSDPARVRQNIGVTFQSPALDPRLSVMQNLRCHGAIYGLPRHLIAARAAALLQTFRMADASRTLAGQLSGGQKRRVELAKGLMHAPAVLLLDEPTSGLDVGSRQVFFEVLREHRRNSNTTVIVATHLMEEAELCDQLVLLNQGRMIASGTPAELKNSIRGDRLTIHSRTPETVRQFCADTLGVHLELISSSELSGRVTDAGAIVQRLLAQCQTDIDSVYISRPSLQDVFLDLTGDRLDAAGMQV